MRSDIIYNLMEGLNVVPEILIIVLYYNHIIPKKFDSKKPYILWYSLAFIILLGVTLFISIPKIQLATTFFILIVSSFTLYKGSKVLKIFSAIFYILIILISESLFMGILMLMNYGNPLVLLQSGPGRILGMAGTKIFDFWIIVYSCRIYTSKVKILPLKYWLLIILMPFISALMLNLTFIANQTSKYDMLYYMICICGLLYINLSVFNYFESYDSQIRLSVLQQVMEREQENYKMLESSYNEIRHIKHDMKNQIELLNDLIEKQKYSDAQKHMKKLFTTVERVTSVCYTGNSAIDSIMNLKGDYARNHNISYITKINVDTIDFDTVGLCRIIGNALDNAIEACERVDSDEKYVFISINQIDNKLAIEISNTSEAVDTTHLITSKENRASHGIGLHSIKQTVKEMNGNTCYEYKDGVFTIKILLIKSNNYILNQKSDILC